MITSSIRKVGCFLNRKSIQSLGMLYPKLSISTVPCPDQTISEVVYPMEGHLDVKRSFCKTQLRKSWKEISILAFEIDYKETVKISKLLKMTAWFSRVARRCKHRAVHQCDPLLWKLGRTPGQVERVGRLRRRIFWKTCLEVPGAGPDLSPAPSDPRGLALWRGHARPAPLWTHPGTASAGGGRALPELRRRVPGPRPAP